MPFFSRLENQGMTPVSFSCSAIITRAPNQISVSQALFSERTSSQSIVPVMMRVNRPRKATAVGSSVKAGPKIIAGTLAQSTSSIAKVPIITHSLPESGPMRFSAVCAYPTASGVAFTSGGERMEMAMGMSRRQTRPGTTM